MAKTPEEIMRAAGLYSANFLSQAQFAAVERAFGHYHNQFLPTDEDIEKELLGGNRFSTEDVIKRGAAIECFKKMRDNKMKP